MPFKCFPCFLTPAIKLSTQINKSKIVIRGTKDRPPQGVPEKGCHTGTEKSLINFGGQAVGLLDWGEHREKHKVKRKEKRQKIKVKR